MAIPTGMKLDDYIRQSTGIYKEIRLNESKENPSSTSSSNGPSIPAFSGVLSKAQKTAVETAKPTVQGMTLEDYQVQANRIPAFQKMDRLRMNRKNVDEPRSPGSSTMPQETPSKPPSRPTFSRKLRTTSATEDQKSVKGNRSISLSKEIKREDIHRTIEQTAKKYGLAPELVHSIVQNESNYQPNAVSPAGAMGLMQLMPETAKEMGVGNPFDIRQNIEGGTKYLKKMLDTFDGDLKKALQAYNAGPGAVIRHRGEVPYPETRSYVQRVMASVKNRLG